jgi:hypothetical protein
MILLGLTLVSLVTAIVLLLVVRYTSDQAGIAQAKRAIKAGLFEIRLFNDDLHAIVRAQGEILRHNLIYLRHSLVPLLWILLPLTVAIGQLQACYGYSGLRPRDTALVKVAVADGGGERPALALTAPPGIDVQTPPVWIPSLNEAVWRIGTSRPGDYELAVSVNGTTATRRVHVGDGLVRLSPWRLQRGPVNWMLYPGEPALPRNSAITAIEVTYPARAIQVFGWDLHWMVIFFVLTLIFALLLRRRFRVVI